jgi:hypothetical protein
MTTLQSAVVTLLLAFGIGMTLGVAFYRDEQIRGSYQVRVVQK